MSSLFSFAQNKIELIPSDCSQENGLTMFLLDRAKPKILTKQKIEQHSKHLGNQKMILINDSDYLRIEYTNIFGQIIDTTFSNARKLNEIKICVNTFTDYKKQSLIRESIKHRKKWILSLAWGHHVFESDKLILKPKNGYFKYKYFKNGKRIKRGKIKISESVIERLALFERKLSLMQNNDNSCNLGISYNLDNGIEEINFQDYSCSGFSNEQLLTALKIIE